LAARGRARAGRRRGGGVPVERRGALERRGGPERRAGPPTRQGRAQEARTRQDLPDVRGALRRRDRLLRQGRHQARAAERLTWGEGPARDATVKGRRGRAGARATPCACSRSRPNAILRPMANVTTWCVRGGSA